MFSDRTSDFEIKIRMNPVKTEATQRILRRHKQRTKEQTNKERKGRNKNTKVMEKKKME